MTATSGQRPSSSSSPALAATNDAPRSALLSSPHLAPLLLLSGLCLLLWSKVLFSGQVLLPGAFLRGFAPFGSQAAPWNILQWDALGQYYPWRLFAASRLQHGLIPLWNPHQFAGAPFLANGQSAIFYPLNLPFWAFDVAYAFGLTAALHTLLAALGTYFLAQRWGLSRAASVLAAVAFSWCGYLAAWAMLPTLANTASWLPLLLLLFEKAVEVRQTRASILFVLALSCALLAGHAQIFIYIVFALMLRAALLPQRARAAAVLAGTGVMSALLGAAQLLPTLELARLGHRAAQGGPDVAGWEKFIVPRALQGADLPSLIVPFWPLQQSSTAENFGYVGAGTLLLALVAILGASWHALRQAKPARRLVRFPSPLLFCFLLALFGLLYALGTPLARFFYFNLPGLSQMGGVGRALVLWSLGAALLAGFGLDFLRRRISSATVPLVALLVVAGELGAAHWTLHPIAPRETIYPHTTLTDWLQKRASAQSRVLLLTPREGWLPSEADGKGNYHPPGVLPPNGALVYGLFDVNGYDSLAPRAYRDFLIEGEGADVLPQFNGNMILLNNVQSAALDALSVRYLVSQSALDIAGAGEVLRADGCIVYERRVAAVKHRDGRDFWPGPRDGPYRPASFRMGLFLSLCALALLSFCAGRRIAGRFLLTKGRS